MSDGKYTHHIDGQVLTIVRYEHPLTREEIKEHYSALTQIGA